MATNISAYEPSHEEIFVSRYDEKFEIGMSNVLKCAPITVGFQGCPFHHVRVCFDREYRQ